MLPIASGNLLVPFFRKYKYLEFLLNNRSLYSYLLLTKTEGDVENDGLLESREIMNMNLKADLAV